MSCGIKKAPVVQSWKLDVFCLPVHIGAVLGRLGVSAQQKRSGLLSPHALQSFCFSHAKPCSHSPQPWWHPALCLWGIHRYPRLPAPSPAPRDLQAPWGWWSQMYLFTFSSEFLFIFCTLTWVRNVVRKESKLVIALSGTFILILQLLPRIFRRILLI